MTKLEAKAAALQAANAVTYKARGCTHRVQLDTFTIRGAYSRTVVFYLKAAPDSSRIAQLALKAGSRSISHSIDSAKVTAL